MFGLCLRFTKVKRVLRSMRNSETDSETSRVEVYECPDCGATFEFGPDEKRFYAEHGSRRPKYCFDCRERRRGNRNARLLTHYEQSLSTSEWQEHLGHFGGGRGSSESRSDGKEGGYQTTCTACGNTANVPFIPRNGRPVYCKRCYANRKAR